MGYLWQYTPDRAGSLDAHRVEDHQCDGFETSYSHLPEPPFSLLNLSLSRILPAVIHINSAIDMKEPYKLISPQTPCVAPSLSLEHIGTGLQRNKGNHRSITAKDAGGFLCICVISIVFPEQQIMTVMRAGLCGPRIPDESWTMTIERWNPLFLSRFDRSMIQSQSSN